MKVFFFHWLDEEKDIPPDIREYFEALRPPPALTEPAPAQRPPPALTEPAPAQRPPHVPPSAEVLEGIRELIKDQPPGVQNVINMYLLGTAPPLLQREAEWYLSQILRTLD